MAKDGPSRTKVALGIVLAALLAWSCAREPEVKVPPSIAGDPLTELLSGDDANRVVTEMHGKRLGTDTHAIAFYGPRGANNILYLSVFSDEQTAKQDYMEMTMKMSGGSAVFTPLNVIDKGDRLLFTTVGMGKAHFLFRDHETLVWWQGDTTRLEQAMGDLERFPW